MTKAEKSLGNHQETHGMQDDITEDTPVDDVKAPSVFERAKEEFEAIIDAVHHKKDTPISHERYEFSFSRSSSFLLFIYSNM